MYGVFAMVLGIYIGRNNSDNKERLLNVYLPCQQSL